MAGPVTYIRRKAEDAIAGLITKRAGSDLSGHTIVKGLQLTSLPADCITVVVASATPEVFGDDANIGGHVTGNWFVEVTVGVRSVADADDYDRDTHANACGYAEDVLMSSDVVDQINALDDPTDFRALAWRPGEAIDGVDDDGTAYVSEYRGTLYCMPTSRED